MAEHLILSLEHFPVMLSYLLCCNSGVPLFYECVSVHVCSHVKPSVHWVYESNGLLKRNHLITWNKLKKHPQLWTVFLYCCEY